MDSAANYILHLLGIEVYSFSWDELRRAVPKSEISLKSELARLTAKKEILNLRKGFYLILPPRYRNIGQLPLELYVDSLFDYLEKPYYVGLFSAARLYGASHQQIQQNYVIISLPSMLDINRNGISIRFLTSAGWSEKNILDHKSEAGNFKVSSPALTATDLIHYHTKVGGLNRIIAILQELSEELDRRDIQQLLSWYPYKSTLQRLGYLLDEFNLITSIADEIFEYLKKEPFFPVVLSPYPGQKAGAVNNRWKVFVNIEIESDL